MPEISRFLGIVISMNFRDHPPPHFHVRYNEHRATFTISDLRLLNGGLPPKVVALVLEWAFAHRSELMTDWDLAVAKKPLNKIEPLV